MLVFQVVLAIACFDAINMAWYKHTASLVSRANRAGLRYGPP